MAKYFDKNAKSKQNWTRTENLNICFFVSFDHDCKNLIFGGEILR